MEKRKYNDKTLKAIKEREYWLEEKDVKVLIKPIPETDEKGVLDPRFYADTLPMVTGIKGMIIKTVSKFTDNSKKTLLDNAERTRKMMNGIKSIPIIANIEVQAKKVNDIPIRIYYPKNVEKKSLPILYYIHGGGFVAGSMDVVDEMCKMLSEKMQGIVVQLAYRLAPENPYPAGLNDCLTVLEWIYNHAEEIGGDKDKIGISGDSAGGNLALVCALIDRDKKQKMIQALALLYPSVDAAHMAENLVKARKVYEVSDKHAKVLNDLLDIMAISLLKPTIGEYLGVEDDTIAEVSPLLHDLSALPSVILLEGEYDFLRVENDMLAQKLHQVQNDVTYIRYQGISHGFADQVGVTPQAEDALAEIANFMLIHLQNKKGDDIRGDN